MNVRDDRLTAALGSLTGAPPPPAPVDGLIERGRRARRARRAAVFGASTAAVTAVALTAALTGGTAAEPPSPKPGGAGLVAAVEATAATSFKVEITYTMRQGDRPSSVERYRGAFDAARDRGHLQGPLGASRPPEFRFIGDRTYIFRGTWKEVPGSFAFVARGTVEPGSLAADPVKLLKRLSAAGKVVPAGPSTYRFTYAPKPEGDLPMGERVTGSITVANGKVKRIEQETVIRSKTPELGDRDPVYFSSAVEFSGYGTPVNISRP